MKSSEVTAVLPDSPDTDVTQQSNEELLRRLALAAKARHRHRNLLKTAHVGYLAAYVAFLAYIVVQIFTNHGGDVLRLIGLTFLSIFIFLPAVYGINTAFYRRNRKAHARIVMELARRGEERALGPLLDLMDIRLTASAAIWAQNRSVFVEAMILLLTRLTPESFATLSDAQIHQLTPLLMLREPGLKDAVMDMFMRCGDARTLRALHRFEVQYQIQKVQKWNPFLIVMLAVIKRSGMTALDQESMERVQRCCEAMRPRVEAENRAAQLLRASDSTGETHLDQLLHPAAPTDSLTPAAHLLRPDPFSEATSVVATDVETHLETCVETKTIMIGQADGVTSEEVVLTRG